MKKITLMLALALAAATGQASAAEWRVLEDKDKMTDEVFVHAASPSVNSNGLRARLIWSCGGDGGYLYFLANSKQRGRFWDVKRDSKGEDSFRVVWGAKPSVNPDLSVEEIKGEKVSFSVEPPPQTSAIIEGFEIMKRVQSHSSLLVEVPFYREGNVYFEIPLRNAKAAIEEAKQSCAK